MTAAVSALRAATTDLHQSLHHHRLLAPLSQADLTEAAYRRALVGLFGFHCRAWQAVVPFEPLRELLTATPAWLEEDLAALGVAAPQLPLPPPLTANSLEAALGILYVKEGSLLGGRHLAKAVRRQLGPEVPCRHFIGLGNATGDHWQAILQALAQVPAAAQAALCAAASASFEHLGRWLDHLAAATSAPVDGQLTRTGG